jgi:hypothetical protein
MLKNSNEIIVGIMPTINKTGFLLSRSRYGIKLTARKRILTLSYDACPTAGRFNITLIEITQIINTGA